MGYFSSKWMGLTHRAWIPVWVKYADFLLSLVFPDFSEKGEHFSSTGKVKGNSWLLRGECRWQMTEHVYVCVCVCVCVCTCVYEGGGIRESAGLQGTWALFSHAVFLSRSWVASQTKCVFSCPWVFPGESPGSQAASHLKGQALASLR